MAKKDFTQAEVNRILSTRLKRERERLARDVENCFKRCMAGVHLTLHQEMCALKRGMAAETEDALSSIDFTENQNSSAPSTSIPKNNQTGGEWAK